MNPIVNAIVAGSLGWSAPVSAPYGLVEVGHVAIVSPNSTVEISQMAPYMPYALTCQRSSEAVVVPSAGGGTRQITVNRC